MAVTLKIDQKTVRVESGRVVVETPKEDGTSSSIVLTLCRAEALALATALKETAPKK